MMVVALSRHMHKKVSDGLSATITSVDAENLVAETTTPCEKKRLRPSKLAFRVCKHALLQSLTSSNAHAHPAAGANSQELTRS
eukprot:6196379-Pleurochrysis_carterae.AAC.9